MMLRKVICPTDFSPAAQNAVAYAAKVCQLSGSELELMNVQPVLPHEMLSPVGIKRRQHAEQVLAISNELELLCHEVSRAFHITCTYDIDLTAYFLEDAISMKAGTDHLIVAGTNGADDLFQYFFGSNAFNLVKKADCPVLVVPEHVSYGTIQKIVFAWSYDPSDKYFFSQLKDFSRLFNADILFLHISKHETTISHDVFNALKETTEELFENKRIQFERICTSYPREQIDFLMQEAQPAILAMTFHSGRLAYKFFQAGSQGERQLPNYPMLVFHNYK